MEKGAGLITWPFVNDEMRRYNNCNEKMMSSRITHNARKSSDITHIWGLNYLVVILKG